MTIEIRGTDFVNKGAHLMLLAALEQIRRRQPQARVAMQAFTSGSPYEHRAEHGIYQLVSVGRLPKPSNVLSKMIPDFVRCRLGVVLEREIGVVLDAGGFAYSDQRGPIPTRRAAKAVVRWKQNATRVVLLPQALGPFEDRRIRHDFRVIAKNADLIYARDDKSHKYLTELVGVRDNVRRAPDFTNLLAGVASTQSEEHTGKFCIVPNQRMIDKTPPGVGLAYVRAMARYAQFLDEIGVRPFMLMHEGPADQRLAEKIIEESELSMSVVDAPDPLTSKGIIRNCLGMIGSRYHALVGALSQAVPALAVGWSHKYQGLFDDYGFGEGILSVHDDMREIRRKIQMISGGTERERIKRRIDEHGAIERDRTRQMWDEVFHSLAD